MVLAILALTGLAACGKAPGSAHPASKAKDPAHPILLTQDEVGAILGHAVTSVEGKASDMSYKTAVIGLETTVGVESERDPQMEFSGARKATGMLGGTPEDVPNLGDEAFFGAMSVLYVRKGDFVITITPPNLGLVAASAAYAKVGEAKSGEEQAKAMQDFLALEKNDPISAGLKKGDDVQGALATIAASSKKQGTVYESQARNMAVALAEKLLSKL